MSGRYACSPTGSRWIAAALLAAAALIALIGCGGQAPLDSFSGGSAPVEQDQANLSLRLANESAEIDTLSIRLAGCTLRLPSGLPRGDIEDTHFRVPAGRHEITITDGVETLRLDVTVDESKAVWLTVLHWGSRFPGTRIEAETGPRPAEFQ